MRLSADDLRTATLRRQFPQISGRGDAAVLELFRHLGPIQSQVPRAPFLTGASRLPGVEYHRLNALFAAHRLVKTSNLRGTVHTSTVEHFGPLAAIALHTRRGQLRNRLRLGRLTPAEVAAEIERYCADGWATRDEIVAHVLGWVAERECEPAIADITAGAPRNFIWGHGALLRRPRDGAWDKRTDIYHRTAATVLPDLQIPTADEALTQLIPVHLAAYGPATRRDLAFFFGEGLTRIDAAVARLGDRLVRHTGPDPAGYLDLADPPRGGVADPGVRLLPEFDGLLLGFHGDGRLRFLEPDQLQQVWSKLNGLFAPAVLAGGRLVGTWRTVGSARRTDIEVRMFTGLRALPDDQLTDPVHAVATALALEIADVRVLAGRQ